MLPIVFFVVLFVASLATGPQAILLPGRCYGLQPCYSESLQTLALIARTLVQSLKILVLEWSLDHDAISDPMLFHAKYFANSSLPLPIASNGSNIVVDNYPNQILDHPNCHDLYKLISQRWDLTLYRHVADGCVILVASLILYAIGERLSRTHKFKMSAPEKPVPVEECNGQMPNTTETKSSSDVETKNTDPESWTLLPSPKLAGIDQVARLVEQAEKPLDMRPLSHPKLFIENFSIPVLQTDHVTSQLLDHLETLNLNEEDGAELGFMRIGNGNPPISKKQDSTNRPCEKPARLLAGKLQSTHDAIPPDRINSFNSKESTLALSTSPPQNGMEEKHIGRSGLLQSYKSHGPLPAPRSDIASFDDSDNEPREQKSPSPFRDRFSEKGLTASEWSGVTRFVIDPARPGPVRTTTPPEQISRIASTDVTNLGIRVVKGSRSSNILSAHRRHSSQSRCSVEKEISPESVPLPVELQESAQKFGAHLSDPHGLLETTSESSSLQMASLVPLPLDLEDWTAKPSAKDGSQITFLRTDDSNANLVLLRVGRRLSDLAVSQPSIVKAAYPESNRMAKMTLESPNKIAFDVEEDADMSRGAAILSLRSTSEFNRRPGPSFMQKHPVEQVPVTVKSPEIQDSTLLPSSSYGERPKTNKTSPSSSLTMPWSAPMSGDLLEQGTTGKSSEGVQYDVLMQSSSKSSEARTGDLYEKNLVPTMENLARTKSSHKMSSYVAKGHDLSMSDELICRDRADDMKKGQSLCGSPTTPLRVRSRLPSSTSSSDSGKLKPTKSEVSSERLDVTCGEGKERRLVDHILLPFQPGSINSPVLSRFSPLAAPRIFSQASNLYSQQDWDAAFAFPVQQTTIQRQSASSSKLIAPPRSDFSFENTKPSSETNSLAKSETWSIEEQNWLDGWRKPTGSANITGSHPGNDENKPPTAPSIFTMPQRCDKKNPFRLEGAPGSISVIESLKYLDNQDRKIFDANELPWTKQNDKQEAIMDTWARLAKEKEGKDALEQRTKEEKDALEKRMKEEQREEERKAEEEKERRKCKNKKDKERRKRAKARKVEGEAAKQT